MLPLLGGLLAAGSSLLGGLMNNSAQDSINKQNIDASSAANAQNYEAQKEFAQNGLRWKVADATAAGIHPVYAMGAPPVNFAPSFVGSTSESGRPGDSLTSAGQDIGRAVAATQTQEERAYNATVQTLGLERASLENELLRTQIRRTAMSSGPGFPDAAGSNGATSDILKMMYGNQPLGPHAAANDVQNEYGEVVGDVHGISRWFSDAISAAAQTLANSPSSRPSRVPGEPKRPAPTSGYPQLGGNYNRTRRAPF